MLNAIRSSGVTVESICILILPPDEWKNDCYDSIRYCDRKLVYPLGVVDVLVAQLPSMSTDVSVSDTEYQSAAQRVGVQLPRALHRITFKKQRSRARSGQLEHRV